MTAVTAVTAVQGGLQASAVDQTWAQMTGQGPDQALGQGQGRGSGPLRLHYWDGLSCLLCEAGGEVSVCFVSLEVRSVCVV